MSNDDTLHFSPTGAAVIGGRMMEMIDAIGLGTEVTPAMIASGVAECREHLLGGSLEELVECVYSAMETERRLNTDGPNEGVE